MSYHRIFLEPFDGESDQHTERLHAMVEEMGWSQDRTDPIIKEHREGLRTIFWVVLDQNDPAYEPAMQKLQSEFDHYKLPLISRNSLNPPSSFILIGNIGISSKSLDPPPPTLEKTVAILGFYVSRALHGIGIGTAALDALGVVAAAPPLSAKVLVLFTLSKETPDLEGLYASIERPYQASKEDWYAKRGFEVYAAVDTPEYRLAQEHTWATKWAYMMKVVGGEEEVGERKG